MLYSAPLGHWCNVSIGDMGRMTPAQSNQCWDFIDANTTEGRR